MRSFQKDSEHSVGWALHVVGVIVVMLLFGGYRFLIHERFETCKEENLRRIEQFTALLDESPEVQREHIKLRRELKSLQSSIAAIRARLPQELQQEDFTSDLHRVAERVGLRLEELHWGPPHVTQSHSTAEIQLECNGSYASICRFLDAVGQLARITKIAHLRIEAGEGPRTHPVQVKFVMIYGVPSHESDKKQQVL